MKQIVVAKYLNGYTVRGYTLDVGPKDVFHLVTPTGQRQEIHISELKAVFFVKSLDGEQAGRESRPPRDSVGVKLVVQFFDGEEITGTSFDYSLKKPHFYMFPHGPDDNNERILVNRKAARFISRLKEPAGGHVAEDDETFRRKFEREVYRFVYTLAQQFSDPRLNVASPMIVNYHLGFRKEFGRRVEEYVTRFGEPAWQEFVESKFAEIRLHMGDRALKPLLKVIGR